MKKLYVLFIGLLFSLFSTSIYAVTACPFPVKFTQPDGSKITVLLKGDEHIKWAETSDGYSIIFNSKGFYEYAKLNDQHDLIRSEIIAKDPEKRSLTDNNFLNNIEKHLMYSSTQVGYMKSIRQIYKDQMQKVFPTTGSRKLICILMGYTDLPFTKTQTDFNNLFNQVGYTTDGATGSVKDFYNENSYNQFNLTVTIAGPYVANNNMAYYGANDASGNDVNPRALITEAVQKADPDVNYADFDNDNDGSVDGIYVIFAGYGEEAGASANAIWSHAWSIPTLVLDGKSISKYSCSPELRDISGTGITRIGVICHEFGHVLGAPDFYDTDYSTGGQFSGTGYWDIMASGSWNNNGATPAHHNAYTKTHIYNWATSNVINSPSSLTLPNSAQNSTGFYEYTTTTANDFFICENRQNVGFDANIPGHGLVIYHVHPNIAAHLSPNDINATYPQMMYPVCASATTNPGTTPASYGSINSTSCSFPGSSNKLSFTDATIPGALSWAGANTSKPVTNITENTTSKIITFDFMGGSADNPNNFIASPVSTSQINLSWNKDVANDNVLLAFNISGTIGIPVNGVVYSAGNSIPGGGIVLYSGSGTTFNHSGLNAATTYFYRVWSIKAGNTYSTGVSTNAATYCGTITLPLTENFEGGTIPNCWTQEAGPPTWQFINGNGTSHPASAHSGSYNACLSDNSSTSNTNKLITPSLNLTTLSNPSLKFWHTQETWSPDQDELRIYYKTSYAGSWNLLATYTNSIVTWTQEQISLPNSSSDYYIAFEGDAKYGYGVCIDDISIYSECTPPGTQSTSFTVSSITQTSMTTGWNRGNGTGVLVIAKQGSAVDALPENGTTYTANAAFGSGQQLGSGNYVVYKGTGNSVNVTNLTAGLTYYFSVYEYSATNCYAIPPLTGSAGTSCSNFALPFTEGFENISFPPQCWVKYIGANGLGTLNDWVRSASGYNSSTGAAYVQYEAVAGGSAEDWLVSPQLTIPAGPSCSLNFYEKQNYAANYGSQYFVKVSTTSQTDRASFINVANYDETTFSTAYSQRSIDLSAYTGQNIYIAFVMVQNDGDDWFIDNIIVNNTPPVSNVTWNGTTSTDWNTGTNWSSGTIPNASCNITVPTGCSYYPVVDETANCSNLSIQNGGSLTVKGGANLTINGNLAIGAGISGNFAINNGTCTISGNLYSEIGCSVNISGGLINFTNWNQNASSSFSKGNITLSGGTINASGSILFSGAQLTGVMNGPFILNVGADLYISSVSWATVTNGTFNLLGTSAGTSFFFTSGSATYSSVAYNLNINAPGKTYFLARSDGNINMVINNNFNVTAGTVQAINGTYKLNTFDVNGNLTIEGTGTLNCNGTDDPNINLAGNWNNAGGTYIAGSNTVTLDGTNQSITGANTFYNLTKSVSGTQTLTFGAGTSNRTTITGTTTFQGSLGQMLLLRSAINGTQWEIDPQGTRTISYLDVKDSKNTNAANINACSLVNSGNNTKWDFQVGAAGTIAGTPIVCQGQSGISYLVPAISNATDYLWTVPSGAIISSGNHTNNIIVDFTNAAVSGNITVQGTGACGNGTISPNYVVTVNTVPTITGTTPNSRCGTGTVTLGATSSAGTINWYAAASGGSSLGSGTSFTTPSITSTTTYYVDATNGGCTTAARTAVTATINAIPAITGTTSNSRCGSGILTLGATASAGTINWYAALTGGSSLGTGTSFTTPSLATTTTYYVDATNNGCTTATRTAVTATINTIPTITGTTPNSSCGTGTVILGATASAGTINWYAASTGGSSLGTGTSYTTPSITTTTTYYVDATNGGCTTAVRTAVIATVNTVPTITGTTPNSRCGTGTVILGATSSSGTVNWYAGSTGGSSLGTGTSFTTPSLSGTTTYYVDATNSGCTTAIRSAVTATINTVPTITGTTDGSRCGTGVVTLGATASAGTINWYAASTGGSSLGPGISYTTPSITSTTIYYVDATNSGCITATRTAVTATINPVPTITGTTPNSRCGTGTVIIGATASVGTINWYAASTGGSSLGTGTSYTTPSLTGTTNYYVDATNTGCTTATRTSVTATINAIPTITGTADGSRCGTGIVVLGATASAGTINWYAAPSGGSSLGTGVSFTTPSLATTTTYYVDATNNGCITAARTTVTATINTIPTITGTTPNSSCGTGTIILGATASAGTINWYAASTGGSSIGTGTSFTTPSLTSTTTYYVDATNGSCTTVSRTALVATVNAIPTITGTTPNSHCGSGIVVLGATASAGTINWYAASTGGSSLGTGISYTTPSLASTTTYYVDATNTGCTTATRTAVTATINTVPTIAGTTDGSRCGTGVVTLGATASAGTVNWYAALTGGSSLGTGISFTTPSLTSTTIYYVDATNSGCTTAARTAVTATINSIPTITGTTPNSRCGSGIVTLSATASAGTINWYSGITGGSSLGTGTSFTTPSLTGTTNYYVDATNGGCTTTSRTTVAATINAVPTITGTTDGSRCGTGTVVIGATASTGTINWYAAPSGGSSLGTGVSFTTPGITSTTNYYVDATANGCTNSSRTTVIASINTVPTITGTTDGSRCGTGTVVLGATASAGTINWYAASTGGSSLGSGTSFTTPSLTNTASYYVDATDNGCVSITRTAITATVNIIPSITGTTPASICIEGSVTLGATASAGIISWYDASSGGSLLGTGTSYTTPSLTSTTDYYVDATANGCTTSTRTVVTATITPLPTVTSTNDGSNCGTGTVTLGATASAGILNWYEALTGGSSLGTGTSFTTPGLTSTTSYYVDATDNGCTSVSRTEVIATIKTIPAITGTTDNSRCGTGSVTLGATVGAGTINWYAASSGGSTLGTGNSFITPSLTGTTTYYVDATDNGCTTTSRVAVIATINVLPDITGIIDGTRCGTGTVTLGASASAGTINWYEVLTGGSSVGTGASFTTPEISSTTNYYVDATDNGCSTASRTAVTATIATGVSINGTTEGSNCGTGTVTLGATASAGTINWYDAATGGTSLGTGTCFITPVISITSTYYVDAEANGCTTDSRTAVIATIKTVPTITGTTEYSRCGTGSVILGATSSAGTINWYQSLTGDTSLATGTSFTTPELSSTTVYYVDATDNGCTTETRTGVYATISYLDTCNTGIGEYLSFSNVKIFPNPTGGMVEISTTASFGNNSKIELYNNIGKLLKTISIDENKNHIQLDLSKYPAGFYLIKLGTNSLFNQYKIIKK